jgi:hypothetical protein
MLKTTHKAAETPAEPSALPEGWTEHTAPSGHKYYYHAETKKSTYQRPQASPIVPPVTQPQPEPIHWTHDTFNQQPFSPAHVHNETQRGSRGGYRGRGGRDRFHDRRHRPEDRPKHKYPIPGCSPWVLVKTKLGRRFVHNTETHESFWKFPEDVLKGVIEFDRIERERKERRERGEASEVEEDIETGQNVLDAVESNAKGANGGGTADYASSDEYEEVDVTDDEDDEQEEGEESQVKRQKISEPETALPHEFNEEDIAYQLQTMGQDYGMDDMDYDYEADQQELTEEDSKALFWDMLDDHKIGPYTPWDNVINNNQILEDDRYTVFTNMKARKHAWSEWSTEMIKALKEQREKQARTDPKVPYMAFLQKHATSKLYWPEFRRKYKNEPEMKDRKISDKDREKWYREYINRLKLDKSKLKSDLTTLLKSLPLSALNRDTTLDTLPSALLGDIRYISLSPSIRDPLIETWITTLEPAQEAQALTEEEQAEALKKKSERERREKALADREKRIKEEKRRHLRDLERAKEQLRLGEREIEDAMKVGKVGLKGQLGSETNTH